MNLWAKHGRQLLFAVVALFFFACEDEITKTGFKNPTRKFEVFTTEIDVPTRVMSIDSVYTDNYMGNGVIIGAIGDPELGPINALAFLDINPHSLADTIKPTGVYDSITAEFRLNFYEYGYQAAQNESFSVHEITGDDFHDDLFTRFFPGSSIPYNPSSIGTGSFVLNPSEFRTEYSKANPDTLIVHVKLSDTYGQKLFNFSLNKQAATTAEHQAEFWEQFKGLALVPENPKGAYGIRMDSWSKLNLHYHTLDDNGNNKDTLTRVHSFTTNSFSNITIDRSNSELSQIPFHYKSIETSQNYVQSGVPVVTKLDLSEFYKFIREDSVKDIVINQIEMVVSDIVQQPGFRPHDALALKLINNNEFFFNYKVQGERALLSNPQQFIVSASSSGADFNYGHYFVSSELSQSNPMVMFYDEDKRSYSGYLTTFLQRLMENDKKLPADNQNRVRYLALTPPGQLLASNVTRTIFPLNSIKLKVYFTRPITNP